MAVSSNRAIGAGNLKRVVLLAPPNCTGRSGIIGDTILQSSLVRTLLDRSLFPRLEKVYWWGAKWIVDEIFPYFKPHVETYEWDGTVAKLPNIAQITKTSEIDAALICTQNDEVIASVKGLSGIPCFAPVKPLNAQSSDHLCRQLHSCLDDLGLHVADLPSPRIVVDQDELNDVRDQMTQEKLAKLSSERVFGEQDFDPSTDKVFLIIPAVGVVEDRRTWTRDEWKKLVHILAEVGMVAVLYNPEDESQRRAAGDMVSGEPSAKPRFAIGLRLHELAIWACVSTVSIVRDSGPLHVVAASVGPEGRPRVLGLFSIMRPSTWKPLSDNLYTIGQWPLPLSQAVTPNEVAVRAANIED
ncbi:MAG: hypothetical protein JNJ61_07280 [Anaerolineae bacterium]|nr:hypothetical protein [Anaerolineae bacterium]